MTLSPTVNCERLLHFTTDAAIPKADDTFFAGGSNGSIAAIEGAEMRRGAGSRDQSPSIGIKRKYLAVDPTVKIRGLGKDSTIQMVGVQETIEWE